MHTVHDFDRATACLWKSPNGAKCSSMTVAPKLASMPALRTFHQSLRRGLLPKCIKVCPDILYNLLAYYQFE